MNEPMLSDIRRQRSSLGALLRRADEIRHHGAAHVTPPDGGRLFTAASGDGWFAARAAAAVAARGYSLPYRPCSSFEFLCYEAPRIRPSDRLIVISMSGNVDRVVEGVARARSHGAGAFLVTNGDGGRLSPLVDARCSLDIPELAPFLCGTSTYTGTLLALWLLLDGAGESADGDADWRFDLRRATDAVAGLEEGIATADAFAQGLAETAAASSVSGVRFLSAGPNLASADYGAAKLVELTRIPVWSDDLEEFAHRQYWSMDVGNLVVYLSANSTVATNADPSAAALADLGVRTVSIETAGCPVRAAAHRLTLPDVPEWLSPLLFAIPLQLFAYHLARATGFDPNTRRHLKDDSVRFRVSRKLTRRSLIGTGQ